MKPYQPNLKIREIKIGNMKAGGDTSYPFMKENENSAKALVALEIPYVIDSSYPAVLKEFYGDCDFEGRLKKVSEIEADLVSVKFNIERIDEEEIRNAVQTAEKLIKKPRILRGANNTKTDKELVPLLAKSAARRRWRWRRRRLRHRRRDPPASPQVRREPAKPAMRHRW